jgi:hypothetical protein
MSDAKITARNGYRCAPDGVTVQHFAFDEIVSGIVADWAVADGYASAIIEVGSAEQLEIKPARIVKVRK